MKFEITILGSSSATPIFNRNPSSQALNINERLYLIDCGEGTQQQMLKFDIKISRIDHIFISHLHLGTGGIFLIVPIACTEAGILGYYFMHLMTKKRTVHLLLLLTVIVFLTLLFWPAWDVAYSPRTPSEFTVY